MSATIDLRLVILNFVEQIFSLSPPHFFVIGSLKRASQQDIWSDIAILKKTSDLWSNSMCDLSFRLDVSDVPFPKKWKKFGKKTIRDRRDVWSQIGCLFGNSWENGYPRKIIRFSESSTKVVMAACQTALDRKKQKKKSNQNPPRTDRNPRADSIEESVLWAL